MPQIFLDGKAVGNITIDSEALTAVLDARNRKALEKPRDNRDGRWFQLAYDEQFLASQVKTVEEKVEATGSEMMELLIREAYRDVADTCSGVPIDRKYLIADAQSIVERGIIQRSPFPENTPRPRPPR